MGTTQLRTTSGAAADQGVVAPVSERELDVLRLPGTDLDDPGTARRLIVSLNTGQTHQKPLPQAERHNRRPRTTCSRCRMSVGSGCTSEVGIPISRRVSRRRAVGSAEFRCAAELVAACVGCAALRRPDRAGDRRVKSPVAHPLGLSAPPWIPPPAALQGLAAHHRSRGRPFHSVQSNHDAQRTEDRRDSGHDGPFGFALGSQIQPDGKKEVGRDYPDGNPTMLGGTPSAIASTRARTTAEISA